MCQQSCWPMGDRAANTMGRESVLVVLALLWHTRGEAHTGERFVIIIPKGLFNSEIV